ncbi:hypothetical protein [Synechococcus sp. UW179A]|uniref:hypothetical protein n=1 Tax=Synechococcus sp. UW179A TaxID=2575510 RepID=UPI000E0ECEA3|nr:hypothetical protein [Synechococcus sp. UW179A]
MSVLIKGKDIPFSIQDSLYDGTLAGEQWFNHFATPKSFTDAEGNASDAAFDHFTCGDYSRHYQQTVLDNGGDWEDSHWDAFIDGFKTEANRLAFERGWGVEL